MPLAAGAAFVAPGCFVAHAAPCVAPRPAQRRARARVPARPRACLPEMAAAVEDALRGLRADAAADAAYVLLARAGAPAPPETWPALLAVLNEAGVRGEDLSRVVARAGVPYVLGLDAAEARAVLVLLRGELGFSEAQVVRVVAQRPALLVSAEAVRRRLALLRDMCFSDRDVRHVATKWPGLLALDAMRAKGVIDYLCREEVGFTRASLRSLVRRAPWLLVYDVAQHVAPALRWLQDEFLASAPGVSAEQVIRASPHVLGMNPMGMASVLDYLGGVLGFDHGRVVSIVRQFPPILTSSVDDTLRPAVNFLIEELTLNEEDLARIVRAFPAILTLDVETEMRRNVDFLRSRGVGNVGRIVARLPPVLSYDVETNLAPKLDYLETGLGLSAYDILRFPGYFSYSLTKVIEPRTRFLQKCGIPVTQSGLNMALTPTDEAFCHRVAFAPYEDFAIFRLQLREKRATIASDATATVTPREEPAKDGIEAMPESSAVAVVSAAAAAGAVPSASAVATEMPYNLTSSVGRVAGEPRSSDSRTGWRGRRRGYVDIAAKDSSVAEESDANDGEDVVADKEKSIASKLRAATRSVSSPAETEGESVSTLGCLPFEQSLREVQVAAEEENASTSQDADVSSPDESDDDIVSSRPSRPSPLPASLQPLNPPRQRRRKRRLRATDARLPWSTKVPPASSRLRQDARDDGSPAPPMSDNDSGNDGRAL